jgi:hypothetical protein
VSACSAASACEEAAYVSERSSPSAQVFTPMEETLVRWPSEDGTFEPVKVLARLG